jgi:hypothetical protein
MKTCNGCKYLYLKYGFFQEWWCSFGLGEKVCDVDGYTVKEVPTPEWCKKEVKDENL